ncbi:MAG: hypothetical protein KDD76_04645, partial [Rickettsiales bacterium]|nr:hypothetical protein [Rickettsiales bacterium]
MNVDRATAKSLSVFLAGDASLRPVLENMSNVAVVGYVEEIDALLSVLQRQYSTQDTFHHIIIATAELTESIAAVAMMASTILPATPVTIALLNHSKSVSLNLTPHLDRMKNIR